MDDIIHKYIKLYDFHTNELLCSGEVIASKDRTIYNNKVYSDMYYASVDNKVFFNINSKNFKIEILNNSIETYVKEELNYKTVLWRDYPKIRFGFHLINRAKYIDIVLDNDINGLDEEVKSLVHALNKIKDVVTDGSCSGHGHMPLWVSCHFYSIKPLIFLKKLFDKRFPDDFLISSMNVRSQTSDDSIGLCIISYKKGKEAYKKAQELAECINVLTNNS